jgi:hypothetical protein
MSDFSTDTRYLEHGAKSVRLHIVLRGGEFVGTAKIQRDWVVNPWSAFVTHRNPLHARNGLSVKPGGLAIEDIPVELEMYFDDHLLSETQLGSIRYFPPDQNDPKLGKTARVTVTLCVPSSFRRELVFDGPKFPTLVLDAYSESAIEPIAEGSASRIWDTEKEPELHFESVEIQRTVGNEPA